MEKKERDMEKPVGTHMNPTGTLHRDTKITKRDTATRERDAGGQWGRNLGTLPAGETDVTLFVAKIRSPLITEVYVDAPNNTVMFIFVHNALFPCYCR